MSQVLVELYWADWCGYCIRFKPIWKEIVKMANNGEIKKNNIPVDLLFKDYLHTQDISKYQNPAERSNVGKTIDQIKEDMVKMETDKINSYPTIKINGKDYNGPREKNAFLKAILDVAVPTELSRLNRGGKGKVSKSTKKTKTYKLQQTGGSNGAENYEQLYREFKMKYNMLKKAMHM